MIKCYSCGKEFEPSEEWQNNCNECMDEFNRTVEEAELKSMQDES